jgi:GT2 family glycosyltransferase
VTERSVSVVIPTHDRRASLERALRALCAQSYPADAVEIVVVADGCTDKTAGLAARPWPVRIRLIEQAPMGAAAARNRGAGAATGDLLIFLDDDIEVSRTFVAAHVDEHAGDDCVVIGYLPPHVQERRDFFAIMLRSWWEAMFERMRDPGHRFSHVDLLSGNFSVPSSLFARVGGFDETLQCHEDYELGFRLIAAGARMRFAERAAGWHHELTDLRRALRRKRDEGRADVALARLHPTLVPALPISRNFGHLSRRGRMLMRLALARPVSGDLFEAACRSMLPVLEAARLRGRWRRLLDDLLSYWYWRGVAESVDAASLSKLTSKKPADHSVHDVELRRGLHAAAREIDDVRPEAIRLLWGSLVVATIAPQPGAEALQGRHLRSLLQRQFPEQFADTLALAHLLDQSPAD